MTSDLDLAAQRLEEINSKEPPLSAIDIEDLIKIHRAARGRRSSGTKAPSSPKSLADLSSIMSSVVTKTQPASSTFKLRARL